VPVFGKQTIDQCTDLLLFRPTALQQGRRAMQKLAGQTIGQSFEHRLRVIAACQHAPGTFQLGALEGFSARV
jgi:hypothetical protein